MVQRRPLRYINDDIDFRQHQVDGVRWCLQRTSGLIADDMGLGKSLQILTTAAVHVEDSGLDRVLCVSPLSLKYNWEEEIGKHTTFTYHILDGTPKQRAKQLDEFDAQVLIVNYEQVVSHADKFLNMGFGFVLLDEGHYIKNSKSKRTKAVNRLIRIPRRWVLTGSPILNQVNDLWSILHFIDPMAFPKYWTFLHRYAVFGGYMDKQIVGVKNERELNEVVARYMLRRTKKELGISLKMPPRVERTALRPGLQEKLYKQAKDEMQIDVPNADPMEIQNAMSKLLRLKQICGTTAAIEGQPDESSKLDRAEEICQEIHDMGEPSVVFTQFRPVQACMVARLEARGMTCFQLHGHVPANQRQATVKQWEAWGKANPDTPPVLVCTIQVAGVGLNMVYANHALFLDRLWSPKLNEQAEDRLDRIGQTEAVTIIDFEMHGTVEQRVAQVNRAKKELFGAVIGDGDTEWKRKVLAAIQEADDDV